MSKKLFVGNLPFNATDADLRKVFEGYGELTEVVIIRDKFSGRSKGFGFVTVADDAQAEKAIAALNGTSIQGRALTINEAKPFEPGQRPQRREGGGGGRRFNRREEW